MPSSTFFGLPEAKQAKIIAAAREAFTRVPASQVTVADVVQLAQIPRGSFYQYFKDKDDLYFYLISTFKQHFQKRFVEILDQLHGDLFAALKAMFHQEIFTFVNGPDKKLLRNLFMDLDYRNYQRLSPMHVRPHHHFSQWTEEIKAHTDLSLLNVDEEQFDLLIHILLGFLGHSTARYFMLQNQELPVTSDDFDEQFDLVLSWFENGVLNSTRGNQA
ncbi:TetR family transcriptional regulator [Lapidilactobacillus gannanensis]|uniref:TetR family transcriptional regulator n=1 Tax=Lapidilactobacillus gannanensis TaxID=2486002 RepID=A0ABW4BNR9_9LACO|nr:TetR family transcriptional regulator [Lapidilactobacillus gannanensis]